MAAFGADVSTGMALDPSMVEETPMELQTPITTAASSVESSAVDGDDTAGKIYSTEETDQFADAPGGALPPAVKSFLGHRQFNTTSTVMARNTIANPDLPQIFFTLGSVLQAQMIEDEEMRPEDKFRYPVFDLIPQIRAEYGGEVAVLTEDQLEADAQNDPFLREKLVSKIVPTVDTIVRFMKLLHGCAKYSTECNIIALVYLNRMSSAGQLSLSMTNWRCVWLTCIILAQKMWDDRPLKTSAFTQLVPPLEKKHLRNFEAKALELLDYSIGVKPALYVKYYFELRQLFISIIGFKESDWQMPALSIVKAKRLDALCDRKFSAKTPTGVTSTPGGGGDSHAIIARGSAAALEDESNVGLSKGNTLEDVEYNTKGRFVLS